MADVDADKALCAEDFLAKLKAVDFGPLRPAGQVHRRWTTFDTGMPPAERFLRRDYRPPWGRVIEQM
jgi:hypothetical protein